MEQKLAKSNAFFEKESLLLPSNPKEIFYKIFVERMNTIEKLHKIIDFTKLAYTYKISTANLNVNNFIDSATLSDDKKSNTIKLADAETNQMHFKSKLDDMRIVGRRSEKEKEWNRRYYKSLCYTGCCH